MAAQPHWYRYRKTPQVRREMEGGLLAEVMNLVLEGVGRGALRLEHEARTFRRRWNDGPRFDLRCEHHTQVRRARSRSSSKGATGVGGTILDSLSTAQKCDEACKGKRSGAGTDGQRGREAHER